MTMKKKQTIFMAAVLLLLLAASIAVDAALPSYHIAVKVIEKATVYALVAVSMNLLNGFTGLFSLGQAGFMLLGAYAYGILTIPVAKRESVYQYFDGGAIHFSLPEIFAGFLGEGVGSTVGMLAALLVGYLQQGLQMVGIPNQVSSALSGALLGVVVMGRSLSLHREWVRSLFRKLSGA